MCFGAFGCVCGAMADGNMRGVGAGLRVSVKSV